MVRPTSVSWALIEATDAISSWESISRAWLRMLSATG
jgi:hypothetical protein